MRSFAAIFFVLVLGGVLYASSSVDPMKIGVGARSLAMGRAGLVSPGDINAIFVNPANAAYLGDWGMTSMYTSLLEGELNYTLLGGGKKFDFGGLGLAYLSGAAGGLAVTTRDAEERIVSSGSTFDYANSVLAVSWGRVLREDLAAGAVLKAFNKGFGGGYASGAGLDLDLGLLFQHQKKMTLGAVLQNVLPTGLSWDTGAAEDVPLSARAGLSYQARENLLVAVDAELSPFALHTGIEWMPDKRLALRGGFDQIPAGSGKTDLNITMGLGAIFDGFSFDYAYYIDNSLAANSTHYFSLGYLAPADPLF